MIFVHYAPRCHSFKAIGVNVTPSIRLFYLILLIIGKVNI